MSHAVSKPDSPLPDNSAATRTVRLQSRPGWQPAHFAELWHYRELFWFLTMRDVKVRYKQTALGVLWAVIQPVMYMLVFTVFLGGVGNLQKDSSAPYALLTFAALLPWTLFSNALSNAGNSLVGNERLVSKVYFPRVVIPVSAVLGGLVDFAVAMVILVVMMVGYHIGGKDVHFRIEMFALPLLVLMDLAVATGAGLWLSALNVEYRDVRYVIPFLVQVLTWASAVPYPSTEIHEPLRWWCTALNPVAAVVEGFRWTLLGIDAPSPSALAISATLAVLLLVSGLYYFRRVEQSFADVI
jgi:lipopolysaccharide transport system permease protein